MSGSSPSPPPAGAVAFTPPINTLNDTYQQTSLNLKGTTITISCIGLESKFERYSNLQLRVFDYINSTKKSLSFTPAPAAATPAAQKPIMFGGQQKPGQQSTFGQNQQKNIDYSKIEFPPDIPAPISTSSPFYLATERKARILSAEKQEQLKTTTKKVVKPHTKYFESKQISHRSKVPDIPEPEPIEFNSSKYFQCEPPVLPESPDDIEIMPPLKDGQKQISVHYRFSNIHGIIDLFTTDPGDDIIAYRKHVAILPYYVDIYRIKEHIPLPGEMSLNQPALVTMNNVWPRNETLARVKPDLSNPNTIDCLKLFEEALANYCQAKQMKFVSYQPEYGTFLFSVENWAQGPFMIPKDDNELAAYLNRS